MIVETFFLKGFGRPTCNLRYVRAGLDVKPEVHSQGHQKNEEGLGETSLAGIFLINAGKCKVQVPESSGKS